MVCAAVLQHLPSETLFDAVVSLRGLLRPGGFLLQDVQLETLQRRVVRERKAQGNQARARRAFVHVQGL